MRGSTSLGGTESSRNRALCVSCTRFFVLCRRRTCCISEASRRERRRGLGRGGCRVCEWHSLGTCKFTRRVRRGLDAHREELVHIFENDRRWGDSVPFVDAFNNGRGRVGDSFSLVAMACLRWERERNRCIARRSYRCLVIFVVDHRGWRMRTGGPVSRERQHTLGVVLKVVYRCVFKVYCRRVLLRRQDVGVIGHVSAHSAVCGY